MSPINIQETYPHAVPGLPHNIQEAIDIIRDAFMAYLDECGYESRKIYASGVQMAGKYGPTNVWVSPLRCVMVCNDRMFSYYDPDAFPKIIAEISKYRKWDNTNKQWV